MFFAGGAPGQIAVILRSQNRLMKCQLLMNNLLDHAKPPSRRNRVALLVVVVVLCVVVAYLFNWRIAGISNATDVSASVLKREKAINALISSKTNPASDVGTARSQHPSTDTPVWKTILDNLSMLLKGDKVDVCGLNDFDAALFIAGDTETSTRAFNTTMAQLIGKLLAGGKPEERTQALYLQALLPEWSRRIEDGGKYRICGADLDCMVKLINANTPANVVPDPMSAAEPLIKLALTSRDPNIIAAAIYACQGARVGACGTISVADWAAVDADNAAVWLMMANDALSRNDTSARDGALRRAAMAPGYDLRIPSLASVANSDLVEAQSPIVQFEIRNQLAISNILPVLPQSFSMVGPCIRDMNSAADEERRALCDTLANKLLRHDESLVGLINAIVIGAKLVWDAPRLQALRDEKAVGLGWMRDAFPNGNMFSCQQLAQSNLLNQNALTKSERQVVREVVANSGKSLAEVASEYRARYPSLSK